MFKLTFKTDNAAFNRGDHPDEVARILRDVAIRIQAGHGNGKVYDLNGNTVGEFDVKAPDSRPRGINPAVLERILSGEAEPVTAGSTELLLAECRDWKRSRAGAGIDTRTLDEVIRHLEHLHVHQLREGENAGQTG
jgi:hypothetical protein